MDIFLNILASLVLITIRRWQWTGNWRQFVILNFIIFVQKISRFCSVSRYKVSLCSFFCSFFLSLLVYFTLQFVDFNYRAFWGIHRTDELLIFLRQNRFWKLLKAKLFVRPKVNSAWCLFFFLIGLKVIFFVWVRTFCSNFSWVRLDKKIVEYQNVLLCYVFVNCSPFFLYKFIIYHSFQ